MPIPVPGASTPDTPNTNFEPSEAAEKGCGSLTIYRAGCESDAVSFDHAKHFGAHNVVREYRKTQIRIDKCERPATADRRRETRTGQREVGVHSAGNGVVSVARSDRSAVRRKDPSIARESSASSTANALPFVGTDAGAVCRSIDPLAVAEIALESNSVIRMRLLLTTVKLNVSAGAAVGVKVSVPLPSAPTVIVPPVIVS